MNKTTHLSYQTECTENTDVALPLTLVGGNLQPKVIKQVRVIGGTGDMWGDKQFRQQHRVIDKKQVAYAVASGAVVELVVKKYDKNMSLYNSQ